MPMPDYGLLVIIIGLLYFVPSLIACLRHSKAVAGIFVINLFLGWTALGWVIALAWAAGGAKRDEPTKSYQHPYRKVSARKDIY